VKIGVVTSEFKKAKIENLLFIWHASVQKRIGISKFWFQQV